MKQRYGFFFLLLFFAFKITFAQQPENWTKEELMEPAQLAAALDSNKNIPLLICVGPGASIPHSIDIGQMKEKENEAKFTKLLTGLKRNTAVVVYCGCCPFEHCPNVRPAIARLKELKFTNYKLLNLPHNLKTDWLDKGYPSVKL